MTAEFTSFAGNKRTIASDTARTASFNEIPIISLKSPNAELIAQLRDACTRVGFFYIQDHDVPQEKIDKTFEIAKSFFAQEKEVKNEINYKKSRILRGYEPPAEVRTDETKKADLNEAFNWGYEKALDPERRDSDDEETETKQTAMSGQNAWPTHPSFKSTLSDYYTSLLTLARHLLRLFAQVLDLQPTYFDPLVTHPGAMARLIHYPPQSPNDPTALGIGAHTDIECFTILCQGAVPALQILNAEGEWIQAPPVPGTFVVNIGDMLARWTNDRFISTVHRVWNVTGEERYSIPFFFGVNYDVVIETLEGCLGKGEEGRYAPVVAGDYVYGRLSASRLPVKGKAVQV